MNAEQSKTLVRRWVNEGWNRKNLAVIDELFTDDFAQHSTDPGTSFDDKAGLKLFANGMLAAMPDLTFTVDDLVAEGEKVVWRFTMQGTQTGALPGIPPSGRQAGFTGTIIFRTANGKLAEAWVNYDALGFLQGLGVIPQPA